VVFPVAEKNLLLLLLAQLAVLLLSTCVVFIDAGEQAVLERFGKPVTAEFYRPARISRCRGRWKKFTVSAPTRSRRSMSATRRTRKAKA